MALLIDGSTPARVSGTGSATTASFTAPSGALLLACTGSDTSGGVDITMDMSDTGGLVWTKAIEENGAATPNTNSYSGIHYATTSSSVSRTATITRTGGAGTAHLKLYVLTGQDSTPLATIGASNHGNAIGVGASLTTGSLTAETSGKLFCVVTDYNAGAMSSGDLTTDFGTGTASNISGYKDVTAAATINGTFTIVNGDILHWTQVEVRLGSGGGGGSVPNMGRLVFILP